MFFFLISHEVCAVFIQMDELVTECTFLLLNGAPIVQVTNIS